MKYLSAVHSLVYQPEDHYWCLILFFSKKLLVAELFAIISHPDAGDKTTITESVVIRQAIQRRNSKGRGSNQHAKSTGWNGKQRGAFHYTSVMQFPYADWFS